MQATSGNSLTRNKVWQRIFGAKHVTWLGIGKRIYQTLLIGHHQPKVLVYIIGCQRSGTTMLLQAFARDWNTKTYAETGLAGKNSYRLRPASEIEAIISKQRSPLNIVKPLRDAQAITAYLDYFPESKAIWLYRHYTSVAKSNLVQWDFESAKRNLRPFINAEGKSNSWSAEGATEHSKAIVKKYFDEDMAPNDAAACFWYVRNRLFFDLALDKHPRVTICKYEDLVVQPQTVLRELYQFIGYPYPGDQIVRHIHAQSVEKQTKFELNPEIKAICDDLLDQLNGSLPVSRGNVQ